MQEEGWTKRKVLAELKDAKEQDFSFADGEILGSMCTMPHEIAAEANAIFLESNLGDPGHFPGTHRLEQEAIADLAALLHAPKSAEGRFVSGGTEANIVACHLAREKTGKKEILAPESAHFSFEKAARLLGMRLKTFATDSDGRADVAALEAAITKQTALVVAVAGTTELGRVDPIERIEAICKARGLLLHVDAAYGGYLLPFLEESGRRPVGFDFDLDGVWSIGIDPHKGGMSTIPAGVLLLRDGKDWSLTAVRSPYLSTDTQSTLLGTRPGAAAAACWAVHRHLGRAGFASVAERTLDDAAYLAARLPNLGLELAASPELTVVTFRADNPQQLQKQLQERGWSVNVVPRLQAIRIVVNPHVTRPILDRFLKTLSELVA